MKDVIEDETIIKSLTKQKINVLCEWIFLRQIANRDEAKEIAENPLLSRYNDIKMYLCEVSIQKFHSFEEETKFVIEPQNGTSDVFDKSNTSHNNVGIIVGPNGSGKSNIFKAIWSLLLQPGKSFVKCMVI